jgi:hypothetical protein
VADLDDDAAANLRGRTLGPQADVFRSSKGKGSSSVSSRRDSARLTRQP